MPSSVSLIGSEAGRDVELERSRYREGSEDNRKRREELFHRW